MDKEQAPTVVRPALIKVRTKSLTDEHVKELMDFYADLLKKDSELKVTLIQEVSEETKTYIQVDFYSKDESQIDGIMIPYKE